MEIQNPARTLHPLAALQAADPLVQAVHHSHHSKMPESDVPTKADGKYTSHGYFQANGNMSYYPFTAVIKGDAELSNGEGVNLTVEGLSSVSEDELYLDQMFVREEGNQYYVYKKGENGRLTKQYVEVGKNISGTLEITGGITFEDEIAFPYGRDVKEGAKTESVDTLYDYN